MISFMSISMSSASEKIILEDYISSFAWEKRIVLFISKSKYVYFINETDNFLSLHDNLALLAASACVEWIKLYTNNKITTETKQDHSQATYAKKIKKISLKGVNF